MESPEVHLQESSRISFSIMILPSCGDTSIDAFSDFLKGN